MVAIALTDHDGMHGVVRFADVARELGRGNGFRPGAEPEFGGPQNGILAAWLREVIGVDALNPLIARLSAAVRTVIGRRRLSYPDRHLAKPLPPPDNLHRKVVHSYVSPPGRVPIAARR